MFALLQKYNRVNLLIPVGVRQRARSDDSRLN